MLLNRILTRPCALTHTVSDIRPAAHVFTPVDLTKQQLEPLTFTAELAQDALGSSRGRRVTVALELFGGKALIGSFAHAACVLLGPRADTEEGKQKLLGP